MSTRTGRRRAACLLIAGIATPVAAFAQTPRLEPLPVETALSQKEIGLYSAIRLSPDERSLAYTICDPRRMPLEMDPRYRQHSRTGVWGFGLGCDVWITDTASGESKNLTEAKGSSWAPKWSPDGKRLAFYSDRAGTAALWVWSAGEGLRRVSDVIVRPWGYCDILWTPDSRSVVVPVMPEGLTIEAAANLRGPAPAKDAPPAEGQPTVTVFEFHPMKAGADKPVESGGVWSTELHRSDAAVIDIASGRIRRLVTGEKPAALWLSPDGSLLAFDLARGFAAEQSQQQLFDLKVVPISGGASRTLAERVPLGELGISAAWSPDSRSIGYLSGPGDAFVVAAAGGAPRRVNGSHRPKFGIDSQSGPFFGARNDELFYIVDNAIWRVSLAGSAEPAPIRIAGRELKTFVPGGRPDTVLLVTRRADIKDEGLYALTLSSGRLRKVFEGAKSLGRNPEVRVAAGLRLFVFGIQDAASPEDLWALASGSSDPRRLTRVNPAFDEYVMGTGRLVDWRDADGKSLSGAVLLPAGYVEGRRYPLVVFVYNGGHLQDSVHTFGMRGGWGIDDNFQLLATRGYAIFLPDAPSDWKDQMRDLPKTVLPGVNRVIDLGIADPDRLGIMGHSNGGYSTLALITLTNRFQAAVMRAGMGDFFGFYGELGKDGTNYGVGVSEYAFGMGSPWESRARYVENSPVLYLDRVQTPLLIVHGTNDDAVSVHLAEEVFVDLRRLGKEVVLARYEGEGHQLQTYANQLDYVNRMLAWFGDHLKKSTEKP